MKKVSIITTVYNAEKFVDKAITSVLCQKNDDTFEIEYIIVNDHTTDNSVDVINNTFSNWKRNNDNALPKNFTYRLVTPEKNLGCGGARRFGIQNATGDYFMFLDADDYYTHLNFVQRAVKILESTESDIVEFGLIYNYANGRSTPSVVNKQIEITDTVKALISIFKDNIIKFHVWTKIIRKEIIDQFEYSDRRTFEDVETIPVWVSLCKKITIVPTIEINYRATQNSIIRDKILNTRLGTIDAIASNFERFKKWRSVLLAMYGRAMIDLSAIMENKTSDEPGFNEMSKLNTYMLSYIFPNSYKNITFNLEDDVK